MDNKIDTRWSPKSFTKPENQLPGAFDENGHQNSSPNSNLCLRDPASCVCLVTANIPPCKSSNSFLFLLFLFSSRLFYYSLRVVAPVSFNNEKKKRIKREAKKGMKSVGGRKNYRPFYRLTLLSGLSRITGASLRDIMRTKRLPSRLVLMSSHARRNCLPLEIGK